MTLERPYWNMEVEPLLNTPAMAKLQWEKLQAQFRLNFEHVPFCRKQFERAGVTPDDLTSFDEYKRRLPVVVKDDFRQTFMECAMDMDKIFESILGVPASKLTLIGTTSGTTGEPVPYPFTAHDLEIMAEGVARGLWRTGLRPGDRVIHGMGLSMFVGGVPFALCFQKLGVCTIPVGAEAGTEKILFYAKLFKANTLTCTPSLAEHLIERAPDVIGEKVESLGIKRIICGGEPGAGVPEVRSRIEREFGAVLYDAGAGGGCSCGHPEYQGMHSLADDTLMMELVDPETKEPIEMTDGAMGESVFTTLGTEGFILQRASVGDVVQVSTGPCPCGASGFRYKVMGRGDDMLKVKGVMVYPAAIDGVITSFVPEVTGEFRIVLGEPPPKVKPPLRLKIEYGSGCEGRLEEIEKRVVGKMHDKLKIRPAVEWLAPNTLPRSDKKTQLIERNYR